MPDPKKTDSIIEIQGEITPEILQEVTDLVAARLADQGLTVKSTSTADPSFDLTVEDDEGNTYAVELKERAPIAQAREQLAEIRERNVDNQRQLDLLRKRLVAA
jgi:hypothetical protein